MKKQRYPDSLARGPKGFLAPCGVGLGLRTDSGNNIFKADPSSGVELRRKDYTLAPASLHVEDTEKLTHETPVKGKLESLESLLSRAGYKETRVFTPEKEARLAQQAEEKKRPRLNMGLLTRRVEQRRAEAQASILPAPEPTASNEAVSTPLEPGAAPTQPPKSVTLPTPSVEKRISSAPALVPTPNGRPSAHRTGPSPPKNKTRCKEARSTTDPRVYPWHSETHREFGAGTSRQPEASGSKSASPVKAAQQGKAEVVHWADVEDSIEEASPRAPLQAGQTAVACDSPSPALPYVAPRLPTMDHVAPPTSVAGVEGLFGRREDGTLFYPPVTHAPPVAPKMRGYPGQPGTVAPIPPAYHLPSTLTHRASDRNLHQSAFPNPHIHQYQYGPPSHAIAPPPPQAPQHGQSRIEASLLRKMRSEADIKIREMERRAEAEEMGRGWRDGGNVPPVPPLPATTTTAQTSVLSEVSTCETDAEGQKKRRVLNRVDLEFHTVDIDDLSDISSEVDQDEHNDSPVSTTDAAEETAPCDPSTLYLAGKASSSSRAASIYHEDRFDPAAYEDDRGDVEMLNETTRAYFSDEEYAIADVEIRDCKSVENDTPTTMTSVESPHFVSDFITPKKQSPRTRQSEAMEMESPESTTSIHLDLADRAEIASPDRLVLAKGLRHAISTPLFPTSSEQGAVTRLSKANVQKFNALHPMPRLPPDTDNWIGKLGSRVWSVGTSVMSNSSKDDHCVPTKSAAKSHTPKAMASLMYNTRLPASPKVVRGGGVVCDSTESEDLPPVPSASPASVSVGLPFRTLRTKLSLQILGKAVKSMVIGESELVPKPSSSSSSSTATATPTRTPTLTPRPDWHDREGKWTVSPRSPFKPASSSILAPKKEYQWTTNIDEVEAMENDDQGPDFTQSFFYKPGTPPRQAGEPSTNGSSRSSSRMPKRQESIKSLRAHLLKASLAAKAHEELAQASPPPPVPAIPFEFRSLATKVVAKTTPPTSPRQPPVFAISSPGAVEAGLPPRELVLEGEEWEGGSYESRKRSSEGAEKEEEDNVAKELNGSTTTSWRRVLYNQSIHVKSRNIPLIA